MRDGDGANATSFFALLCALGRTQSDIMFCVFDAHATRVMKINYMLAVQSIVASRWILFIQPPREREVRVVLFQYPPVRAKIKHVSAMCKNFSPSELHARVESFNGEVFSMRTYLNNSSTRS